MEIVVKPIRDRYLTPRFTRVFGLPCRIRCLLPILFGSIILGIGPALLAWNGTTIPADIQENSDVDAKLLLAELKQIIDQQSSDWNAGKIDGFMDAYWKDERLSFASGGTITRGWQATRDRYHKRYPDAATMGKLTFTQLELESLGPSAALVLGRWRLDRDQPIEGNFSLVWKKIDNRWRIIHDHTSKSE